ncbi:MAG: succinate dehydrogenase/fumarate reductase iron-sulfur subunit [Chitinophaga sp.]|uniref:succinate dehydrogenase/fumarate reductase iron-sulfur subunit n=1 Tax=Chitinophaga sp. TaxID=1869181 RepID=UPI0025C462FF|nr:succinate dehydrogenase/fumarate reductase iron-sulfur subunit [Chitinophaga sp.]MBV8254572.1 succinate dehydrogenase/fumarate reductase iron-sulfur subunit [Chitinophaga sp.]
MRLRLKIWRQESNEITGRMESYELKEVNEEMSFLEMLDVLNEQLMQQGIRPVEFDHDCREGICGQCGVMINGEPHGPLQNTTTCQLHMRTFRDGEEIYIEPFRALAFPVKCDLKIDRSAFDRIIQSGGFISVDTGQAPEANSTRIPVPVAESAFDSAACIGCGACVAACKNTSAALFTSAKITHLAKLPQGKTEAQERVLHMVAQMDAEGFGHCTNTEACEAACPQEISVLNIARMNWEFNKAHIMRK